MMKTKSILAVLSLALGAAIALPAGAQEVLPRPDQPFKGKIARTTKDFLSVIVYCLKTKGYIEGVDRAGFSSKEVDQMKVNGDSSVDVYFAPKAPKGMESKARKEYTSPFKFTDTLDTVRFDLAPLAPAK